MVEKKGEKPNYLLLVVFFDVTPRPDPGLRWQAVVRAGQPLLRTQVRSTWMVMSPVLNSSIVQCLGGGCSSKP